MTFVQTVQTLRKSEQISFLTTIKLFLSKSNTVNITSCSCCHIFISSSTTWFGMDQDLTLIHITHLDPGYHCDPLTPGSPNPPQWNSHGGPAWHSSACSLCGPACGWSRDADRALGMVSAQGPGDSQPCTTSSLSPTSQKTTLVPAGEQRARSHATLSASMNLCATTIQTSSSKMRRTPTQTASWLRWDWCGLSSSFI